MTSNAVTAPVTERVTRRVSNGNPDPTRPDPTQKTLVVAVGRQAQTATREGQASPWVPREFPPPWFRPFATASTSLLSARRSCNDCGVRWSGTEPCWCCGQPGKSWWTNA